MGQRITFSVIILATALGQISCSGGKFNGESSGDSGAGSEKISEQDPGAGSESNTNQPVEVSGGFGLTCLPAAHSSDPLKIDFDCVLLDNGGQKLQESTQSTIDLQVKSGAQEISFTRHDQAAPSSFSFTVLRTEVANVSILAANSKDGGRVVSRLDRRLPRTVAPGITPVSQDFADDFTPNFVLLIADPLHDKFVYATDNDTPSCSSQSPALLTISETTTLKVISCDTNGIASPVATAVYVRKWKDVTIDDDREPSDCDSNAQDCTVKDMSTNLWWSTLRGTADNPNTALNVCNGLEHNGRTDWRLPTKGELDDAVNNDISHFNHERPNWIDPADLQKWFWSNDAAQLTTGSRCSECLWNLWDKRSGEYQVGGNTSYYKIICVRGPN